MLLESGSTLLFIGDSITDCGRNRESGGVDLGGGYVSQVAPLLLAHHPETLLRFLNFGLGGNRVTDLEERWERDVFAHQPDYVSIMIGINDVWRQFDRPLVAQVSIEDYEAKLEALVRQTLPKVKDLILMTPYFIEANREDPMRRQMDLYSAAVKRIAERNDTVFVDVQTAFDTWLEHNPSQQLCGDRVHPNPIGHQIIAAAFLDAVGFRW